MILSFREKIKLGIVSVLEVIFFYILIIVPAEYLLTEYFLVFPNLSSNIKTFVFLAILTAILIINYRRVQLSNKFGSVFLAIILILTGLSAFGYKKYLKYYEGLQTFPKIYKISQNWGIQGILITIEGKNFGPAWLPGEVWVGEVKFVIKHWSPEKVVAEQPVPPKFFKGKLYLKNFEGKVSNAIGYEIKDPVFLFSNL